MTFWRVLTLLAALLIPPSVFAVDSLTFDDELNGVRVVLLDTPCQNKQIIDQIRPEYQKYFQAGLVFWPQDGVKYKEKKELCWIAMERAGPEYKGLIYLVDVDGNEGPMPMTAFAPKDYI